MNVVITGASGGLGSACSDLFESHGHNVLRLSRINADLSKPHAYGHVWLEAFQRFRQVDALINNAAVQGPVGPLVSNDPAEWLECVMVNLYAPAMLSKALLTLMPDGSSIVNVSGGGAATPRQNYSAYAAAKAGLVRFTETLADELRPRKIRVNAVAPGRMNTRMLPPGETGNSPERAAKLILFLASPESRPITGRLISAVGDKWEDPGFIQSICGDKFQLRRIA
jgi:3-oxoacyl-[acyl-carrier protein] reductase